MAAGTYDTVTTNNSGVQGQRIKYISDVQYAAHVVNNTGGFSWTNNGNWVDILGFDVGGSARIGIASFGDGVREIGNNVHNDGTGGCNSNGAAGIVNGAAQQVNAIGSSAIANIVHDVGPPGCGTATHGYGIYGSSNHDVQQNNIVYRNNVCGLQVWHAATNIVMTNNLSFNNAACGLVVGSGDAPGGVTETGNISNNILLNNVQFSWEENGSVSGNTFFNNIVFGNGNNNNPEIINGAVSGTITADPSTIFVNFQPDGSGDYHLKAGSRAIGAGVANGTPATDFEGKPVGSSPDIGPYQFAGQAVQWPQGWLQNQ